MAATRKSFTANPAIQCDDEDIKEIVSSEEPIDLSVHQGQDKENLVVHQSPNIMKGRAHLEQAPSNDLLSKEGEFNVFCFHQ
jgi:arginine/ornithine N-succinyltransferase beta subunit